MEVTYLALLRGVNVGGKNIIAMSALKACLEQASYSNIRTYIQSGNILFTAPQADASVFESDLERIIQNQFGISSPVAVFSKAEWQAIIAGAPREWGKETSWKHNILVLLKPYDMQQIIESIGELKPDIESLVPGNGVLYQSMSLTLFGRTTTGKLARSTHYKRMTIRNYNTAVKLAALLNT